MAGTVKADTIQSELTTPTVFKNSSGTEIGQLCKAWCNYSSSSPTNNGSFNISSLTRLGTGLITFNMTNALSSSSFAYCEGGYNTGNADGPWNSIKSSYSVTSSYFTVQDYNSSGSSQDQSYAYFSIFR